MIKKKIVVVFGSVDDDRELSRSLDLETRINDDEMLKFGIHRQAHTLTHIFTRSFTHTNN